MSGTLISARIAFGALMNCLLYIKSCSAELSTKIAIESCKRNRFECDHETYLPLIMAARKVRSHEHESMITHTLQTSTSRSSFTW